MKWNNLSKFTFICLVVILPIAGLSLFGCGSTETEVKPSAANPEPLRIPGEYEAVSEHLAFRKLEQVTTKGSQTFSIVENSGVDFTNECGDKPDRLVETGAGVALGDVDNDGWVDVYLVSTDGPNKLFRNKGGFEFEDITQKAGVDGSVDGKVVLGSGGSFADVDNDGDLDLFVCNVRARNLLYINDGQGVFSEEGIAAGLDYAGSSKIGSFCDYDRDGDLDLYVLTYQDKEPTDIKVIRRNGKMIPGPGFEDKVAFIGNRLIHLGQRDFLYQNDGTGKFTDVTKAAGISGLDMGLSATWFDLDNDDWLDLYVANDLKGPDKLYRNMGDGTFKNVIDTVTSHTPWFAMGASSGDLNNDGWEDLMVADMSGSNHYKQKVNMGEMSASSWFLQYGKPRQYMRNVLFANAGNGRFLESAYMSGLESTDWTWAVRFVDLDNDGLLDIYLTTGHARNSQDADLLNRYKKEKEGKSEEEVLAILMDWPPVKEPNLVFRNKGEFEFESVGEEWKLDLVGVSHGVAFADFDRDGDLDFVVNNFNDPATVYRNDSSNGARLLVELRGTESNYYGLGAKVEIWQGDRYQQRRLIPVAGYISSDEPALHFGIEDVPIDRLLVTWPNGKQQELRELSGGRAYRIVEGEYVSGTQVEPHPTAFVDATTGVEIEHVAKEADYDDYAHEPLLPNKLSQLGPGAAWGDVNSDGYPDVYIGGPNLTSGVLYLNDKGERFVEQAGPWSDDFLQEDMGAVFFDADSDGDLDLYVVSGSNEWAVGNGSYRDRLYLNDGSGEFTGAAKDALPDLRDSSSSVTACDFDRDGDVDLFIAGRSIPRRYPLAPESRLLRNEGGKFVDATAEVSVGLQKVGLVNSAIWTDFNGDGWVDLMLAMDWGPVKAFANNEGKLSEVTTQVGLGEFYGWWHGLAAGDFDQDGDLDYVATNQGLNTKYHCDQKHPHRLYYQDFDNSGSLDLVEAEYEGDCEVPMRGRSCSSNSMPFIAEKFETFHEFAMAEIGDIYSENIKEGPYVEVTSLESMVFWNEGGKFVAKPLPRLAQISPGFGVTVSDFDGDGWLDIVMAQNFFGAQPETGFMDGGLGVMLKGSKEKVFQAVWPNKSGILVPDDATAATRVDFDLDGDQDVLFVANNGPVRLFENKTDSEFVRIEIPESGCSLKLVGDDFCQMMESGRGEGYLGQSSRNVSVSRKLVSRLQSIEVTWADGTTATIASPTVVNGVIKLAR